MRPYEMSYLPPIVGEIKNGEKGKDRPVKFSHWKLVVRERVANRNNWNPHKEAMDHLGEKPLLVGIRLLADEVADVMPMTRMLYDAKEGKPRCSAPYHPTKSNTRVFATHPETNEPLRRNQWDKVDKTIKGTGGKIKVKDAEYIVASRLHKGEYVDIPCHSKCPLLALDKSPCTPQSILFFRLAPDVAFGINGIFAYRASGLWAQKSLLSSMEAIRTQTGGILANLPLAIRYHEEVKKTPFGMGSVPHPMIEPALAYDEFMAAVEAEYARRSITRKHTNIQIDGHIFRDMVARENMGEPEEHAEEETIEDMFGE